MKALALGIVVAVGLGPAARAGSPKLQVERVPGALLIQSASHQVLLRYQVEPPAHPALSVASGCFFHPLTTPKGVVVTDLAPTDHPYHRGIFLGWVEMHGRKDGDFWGWGEHAPTQGRTILSKGISSTWSRAEAAGFRARSEWKADDDPLVQEDLRVEFRVVGGAHILDLVYRLKADEDLGITRWAFSGFCVRGRKEGTVEMESPAGPVRLPNPIHTDPSTDWPDASWYDMTMRLPDGLTAGVAVLNHPQNPPTLWHNRPDLRLLNPAVCAAAPLLLRARVPLVLRYRVVAHDGPAPRELLVRLAAEWAKG